jgi:hypothetical protein
MITRGWGGGKGRKEKSNSNKTGTRCEEDWRKVKIWGRKNMLVRACAFRGGGRPKQREQHQRGIKGKRGTARSFGARGASQIRDGLQKAEREIMDVRKR